MSSPNSPQPPRLGAFFGTYLARVVDVADPDGLGRVKIRLVSTPPEIGDGDAALWARVAVPMAGSNRGTFFLPDVDDEVAIVFVGGDPRSPMVIGGLWNGSAQPPEQLGGSGTRIDRYTMVGKDGTRIAMVEENSGQAIITLATPGAETIKIDQASGGKITIEAGGSKITVDSQGISLETGSKVKVQASQVEVSAGMVKVDAAMSTFSGMVKCDVLKATTVIGSVYTPGAGNVW